MTARLGMLAMIFGVMVLPLPAGAADQGLITKRSNYSVPETVERFENAIKAKGFMIFAELDHARGGNQVRAGASPTYRHRLRQSQVRYGPDAEVPDVGDRCATEGASVAR